MVNVQTGISIAAPRHEVFSLFTDMHNLSENISGIIRSEVLTEGPIGEGSRFRETRKMFGKEHTEEMWITGFTPNESYCVEAESCGSHDITAFSFADEPGGTRVDVSFDSVPQKFMAKVMTKIMGRTMIKACAKLFDKDMQDLKVIAEGGRADAQPLPA